jgi:hypothetical protein
MASSQMTVRVSGDVKVLWKALADREGRSMTNYIERLLLREKERSEGREITLEDVYYSIESIKQQLDKSSENKKRIERKENKLTAYDVWEDKGVCTEESWEKWIAHMRKMGVPLNHGQGELHFKEFCRYDSEGYNCDTLIEEITERYPWKFPYIPNDWRK